VSIIASIAQMDWQTVLWTIWMIIFTPTFLLIKILYWPVSILISAILVLLSPVLYTVRYCLAPFLYVYSILPRLQVPRSHSPADHSMNCLLLIHYCSHFTCL